MGTDDLSRSATKRRSAHVEWTIEWTFLDHDERKILDHAVHEKSQVDYAFFHLDGLRSDASVSKHPDEARIGTHGIKKQTSFYLVLEAPANKKRCVKMDPVKSWSENLRGRSVVEFPQVLVTAKRNPEELGWEVARDERKIVELENEVESAKPKQIDVPKSSREVKSLDETAPAITIEALTSTAPTAPKATSNELGDTQILEKRKQPDDDILSTLAAIKKARKT